MPTSRTYDVVLYGATSFVGALTAEHLAHHAPSSARIALAGRSRAKLEQVRSGLPAVAHAWPLVVADAADDAALAELAASTTAVASAVGPYGKYGHPLVAACAAAGTHYADLTGEVTFHRAAVDRHDATARRTGARLVHSCGYDSVPSDLGTLLLHQRVAADGAGELADVTMIARFRGGASGGTIDSLRTEIDTARADRKAASLVRAPHALSPDRSAEPVPDQPADAGLPSRVDGQWTAPFVMASYNTRVVRRSNAITDWSYGRNLRYGEVMGTGTGPLGAVAAGAVTGGLGLMMAAMGSGYLRPLLDRLLPAPGTGPSAATRAAGWFHDDFVATTTTGARYRATVAGRGDPGYAATAVMFGEAALSLGLDGDRLPARAGSLTPATGIGLPLVERLRERGQTWTVDRG